VSGSENGRKQPGWDGTDRAEGAKGLEFPRHLRSASSPMDACALPQAMADALPSHGNPLCESLMRIKLNRNRSSDTLVISSDNRPPNLHLS